MKHVFKKTVLYIALTASLTMGSGLSALADEANEGNYITREYEFKTTDPDDNGNSYFANLIEEDGKTYTLFNLTPEIIDEEKTEGDSFIYTSPAFIDESLVDKPEETMEHEGSTYRLKESILVDAKVENRTEHAESPITFTEIESMDELPQTSDITVTDSASGREITVSMPLLRVESQEELWVDSFTFPITIAGYDADYFMLGDTQISKSAELYNYRNEFLEFLNLPSDRYEISSIDWDGPEYTEGGEVCRRAVARGRKLVYNVVAVYGGEASLPAADGKMYQCTYVNEDQPGNTVYTMKVTAYYVENVTPQTETQKSVIERFIEWLKANPILAFSLGTVLVLVFVVLILFLLSRKKKKEEENPYEVMEFDDEHSDLDDHT